MNGRNVFSAFSSHGFLSFLFIPYYGLIGLICYVALSLIPQETLRQLITYKGVILLIYSGLFAGLLICLTAVRSAKLSMDINRYNRDLGGVFSVIFYLLLNIAIFAFPLFLSSHIFSLVQKFGASLTLLGVIAFMMIVTYRRFMGAPVSRWSVSCAN